MNKDIPIDQPITELEKMKAEGKFPTADQVTHALTAVEDPELHINIIDLGLVYDIECIEAKGLVTIDMTLTTPACPYGPQLLSHAHAILKALPKVKEAKVNIVWTPKWDPRKHASESAQMLLGLI